MIKTEKKFVLIIQTLNWHFSALQNPLPSGPTSEYFGTPLIKELRIDFSILV